jgi:hypothetical protein
MATNPYLSPPPPPDKLAVLGQMLTGIGAGIGGASARGMPWYAGIGPGAGMASTMLARGQEQDWQRRLALANWQTQESYRKSQEEKLRAEAALKREELDLDQQAMSLFKGMLPPGTATAAAPGGPPGSLDARAGNDKDMARLAQVGVKFVGDKTPDSSTPARLSFQNAMGLGAGAGGMYAFPTTTAALVGTGYVTNALLNNPYMRAALINRLQRPREGMMSLPLAGVLAAQQGEGNAR